MRAERFLMLPLAAILVPGCFWGETDATMFFKISAGNVEQFSELFYPVDRAEAWTSIFEARPNICPDGEQDCATRERSDLIDVYVPYDTTRGRGLITQKGDLQITTHLDMGEAYEALIDDGMSGWGYLENTDAIYGAAGDGCAVPSGDGAGYTRTGVGRCVADEVRSNPDDYTSLDEDLRLVIVLNLLGLDDVRSTSCQDALDRPAWDLPKTLRVNYSARLPEPQDPDDEDSPLVYSDDLAPLPQCDIEVFSRLQLGILRFNADWYGQDPERDEDARNPFTLDRVNTDGETIRGTVELEELVLPDEGDAPRAKGRYNLAFTSDRFADRDGTVIIEGTFDVEIRRDPEEIQAPERETDIGDLAGTDEGN